MNPCQIVIVFLARRSLDPPQGREGIINIMGFSHESLPNSETVGPGPSCTFHINNTPVLFMGFQASPHGPI